MIRAHDREPVERDILDKGAECVLHGLKCLEMVQMFRIDVGNNRNVGRQFQECTVRFIGLDDHPVSAAEPRIGAVGVDDAAIDHGRIEAAGVEQRCN